MGAENIAIPQKRPLPLNYITSFVSKSARKMTCRYIIANSVLHITLGITGRRKGR